MEEEISLGAIMDSEPAKITYDADGDEVRLYTHRSVRRMMNAAFMAGQREMRDAAAFLIHKNSAYPDEYRQSRCDEVMALEIVDPEA